MKGENIKQLLSALFALCLVSVLTISITSHLTKNRIENNRQRTALKIVTEAMPLSFTNDLLQDKINITDPHLSGVSRSVGVYRARQDGQTTGVVFMPVTAKGYSGQIELAIGIAYDGTLTGVRVSKHQETEGLGDGIDQDKSDWIIGFNGNSLKNTPISAWGVKQDGGQFDQLSGATITSRSVVRAVKNTLTYYELHRNVLYK